MKGKNILFVFILSLLVVFACAYDSHAALTKQLSYQGRLQDASGAPVANGTYSVTFSIYNVSSGGSALYTETQNVTVDKGGFSAYIGSVTPLNLPFNEDYFLGMTVGSDPEMTPRLKLSVVGTSIFALDAGNAGNLGGQPPSSFAPSTHNHDSLYSGLTHTHTASGVAQIIAGSNVTISPAGGTGVVTISSTGGGGGTSLTPAATVSAIGTANVVGTNTNYAREDHQHSIPANFITDSMVSTSAAIAKSKLNLSNSILFSDIAQNGCATGQIVEWNGSAWVCGTDDTAGGGAVVNNPSATQIIAGGNSTTTPIVAKGGPGTTVPMFEVQDSSGAQKFAIMPDGHVFVPSTNQLHVLNVNNDSPTGPMGNMTIDVINAVGGSKLIVTNSDPTNKASLDVEGQVLVGLPTDTAPKVSIETLGASPGLAVKHTGTGTAVDAWNSGTSGSAVVASITNAGNASDLMAGDTGGTGNLLKLSVGGINKMVVGNTGLITTPSVDSTSIANGTITFADVAANGCGSGQVVEYNGSAWVCGTDDGQGSVITGPTSTQTILAGNATTTPLVVKAAASPSVNIFDVQDNASASLMKVMSAGNVMIGSSPSTAHMLNVGTNSASLIIYGNQAGGGNLMALAQGGLNKFLVLNNGDINFGGVAPTITASGATASITLNANDPGATSVSVTNTGAGTAKLSVEGDISLGGNIVKTAAGTTNVDLQDAGITALNITNSGAGTASLQVEGAPVLTSTNGVITNPSATQTILTTNSAATPLVVKGAAAQSVPIFDVQDNGGASHFTVGSLGAVNVISAGNVTLDANAASPTTVQVTNSNAVNVANLSVEGNVLFDGSQVKRTTAGILGIATTNGGITLDAFNGAALTNVQIQNSDATQVANIDLEGDLVRNGTGLFTIKNSTGGVTFDANLAGPTTVLVTNSDAGGTANLQVEGNVLFDGSQVKRTTAGILGIATTNGGITLDAFNGAAATNVQIQNSDVTQVANIDLEGDLIRNGTGLFTIKNSTGGITLDANLAGPTTITLTNSDAGGTANLQVEGNVLIGAGAEKAVVSPAGTLQKVQSGRNCEGLATNGFVTITFPTAYSAAPIVTGTLDKNGTATAATSVSFTMATDVTATTVTFSGMETTSYTECVQWIAVGN